MSETRQSGMGAIIIAALFGIVAWAVAQFGFDFGGVASFIIGLIVAVIVWIILWLGRDQGETHASTTTAAPAPAARPTPAAPTAAAAASPVASASTATAAEPAAPAEASAPAAKAEPAPKPAAKKPAAKKPAAKKAPAKSAAKSTGAKAGSSTTKAAAKKPAAKAVAKPASKARPVAPDGKPEMLSAPRAGGADDLKQIKGVGPKLEKMLNTMGVYHFDQVAGWRKKEVEWVDNNLEGFKGRVSRDEWVKQAKVLAKGGTTEFAKKVKKGGVY